MEECPLLDAVWVDERGRQRGEDQPRASDERANRPLRDHLTPEPGCQRREADKPPAVHVRPDAEQDRDPEVRHSHHPSAAHAAIPGP